MFIGIYTYNVVQVKRVLDGDTIDVILDLGFGITYECRIRMAGYDAPETYRPLTEAEKCAGEKCTEYLKKLIDNAKKLYIKTDKIGYYHRYIGTLYNEKHDNLNEKMKDFIEQNQYYKELLRRSLDNQGS